MGEGVFLRGACPGSQVLGGDMAPFPATGRLSMIQPIISQVYNNPPSGPHKGITNQVFASGECIDGYKVIMPLHGLVTRAEEVGTCEGLFQVFSCAL